VYTAFFGLREKPFDLLPNPDFLYPSRAHKRALTYLTHGIKERAGFILLLGVAALFAFGVYHTWSEHGRHYEPKHLRIGMGGLTALALMIGVATGGKTRGLCRLAAVFTILAGVATAAALYLGHACGAIEPAYAAPTFLAIVLVGVSAWGWLLLPLGSRWAR